MRTMLDVASRACAIVSGSRWALWADVPPHMIDRRERRHRRACLRDVAFPARSRRNKCLDLEPPAARPVSDCLLAVHVRVEHPVVLPERVLVGDPVTLHPDVRLVLPLSQARGPIDRRAAADAPRRLRLSGLRTAPIEVGIAPTEVVRVRVQPVAMTDADGAAVGRAATNE